MATARELTMVGEGLKKNMQLIGCIYRRVDYNATRRLHMDSSTDRIEREILLKAPRSRVWRAMSNAEEFGAWFGVAIKVRTFVAGDCTQGQVGYTCYGHDV